MSTIIVGIGHIDDDPAKCQLSRNLAAAQLAESLGDKAMAAIEAQVTAAGKDGANAYFQRKAIGLTPPRNVGAEADSSMPMLGRFAVRVTWDTAYAGAVPILRYEVLRDGEVVGTVPHTPSSRRGGFAMTTSSPTAPRPGATATAFGPSMRQAPQRESVTLAAESVAVA